MRGYVQKRGNKYSFIIDIGKDPVTKKRRQKRYSGYDKKKEAEAALTAELERRRKGQYLEPTKQTIEELDLEFLEYIITRVENSTYRQYKGNSTNWIIPIIGKNKAIEMKPDDFENFYDYLDGKLARRTIQHIHRILVHVYNYAISHAKLAYNPAAAATPPKVTEKEMLYWQPEEVNKFLESAKDDQYYIGYLIGLTTGMRLGEVLGLKWSDIDLENKVIHVQHNLKRKARDFEVGNPKSKSGYRNITLPDETVEALRAHKDAQDEQKKKKGTIYQDDDFVIATAYGTFVKPTNFGRSWRAAVKKSGVKKIRFHDTRHTHASILFKQGVHPKIVQERLGHSSIQVTLDRYSHFLPNMQEEVAKQFNNFVFNKSKTEDKIVRMRIKKDLDLEKIKNLGYVLVPLEGGYASSDLATIITVYREGHKREVMQFTQGMDKEHESNLKILIEKGFIEQ